MLHRYEAPDEIDLYSAPDVREALKALLTTDDGPPLIVVDLTATTLVDPTGLGVLVGALKRARLLGGGLAVACTSENLLRMFRVTGLASMLNVSATVDEAVAKLKVADSPPEVADSPPQGDSLWTLA